MLSNNNNLQSQSIYITIEDNADGGVDLDTKDHLASIVDGHKTKSK
jgi:hypothetical protein